MPKRLVAAGGRLFVTMNFNTPLSELDGAIVDAGKYLDRIKRFDMPGFQPRAEFIREMKRYGILPQDHHADAPIDPYELDEAYWRSHWHRPVVGSQ